VISKLVWYYERKRSYPALARHREVRRKFRHGDRVRLAVLTVPKCIDDAIWSLWTWMHELEGIAWPSLFVDGKISDEQRHELEAHFPGIVIEELMPWLKRRTDFGPQMQRLIDAFPLGKKTALVAALSIDGMALYSDSDVLAFNRPTQLLAGIEEKKSFYMLDRYGSNYAPVVLDGIKEQGLTIADQLNSGLILLPHHCLDMAAMERFLARFTAWDRLSENWFTEQTTTGLMLTQAGAQPLDKDAYVVSLQRQFVFERDVDYSQIAARHFTGPVRHVMYLKGLPWLLRREGRR
jgi:hypothetical protein